MRTSLLSAAAVLALASAGQAQDGLYYGLGLAISANSTSAPEVSGYEATATDYGVALTLGYRFAAAGTLSYGIEGNLDLMSGKVMSDTFDACTDVSPTWCEVDAAFRLRGTVTSDMANGSRIMGSLGAVIVHGRAEDGPGNYVSATGRGLSLGVAWEQVGGSMPMRVDLNYDAIREDNADIYERDLDMIGLRVSYMF
jgi:hypothetical protein